MDIFFGILKLTQYTQSHRADFVKPTNVKPKNDHAKTTFLRKKFLCQKIFSAKTLFLHENNIYPF